jgi:hypothetical protein
MDDIVSSPGQKLLIPELACRALKSSPALALWLKLVELNGLPKSQKLGYVFASQKWLARELGYSSEPDDTFRNGARTVQRHLDNLYALGLVHWTRVRDGKSRGENRYYLHPPCPQEIPAANADEGDKNVACTGPNVACKATKMSPALHEEVFLKRSSSRVAAAAEEEKPKEDKRQQAIQIFSSLGIPAEKVRRHVAKDPDLGLEVARHCEERFSDKRAKPVDDRERYALGALLHPEIYTIEEIDGAWKRPSPTGPHKPSPDDRAKADGEWLRVRQEEAARFERLRNQPWEGLRRG